MLHGPLRAACTSSTCRRWSHSWYLAAAVADAWNSRCSPTTAAAHCLCKAQAFSSCHGETWRALLRGNLPAPGNDVKDEDGVVAGNGSPRLGHDRGRCDAALGAHIAQRAHHVVRIVLRQAAESVSSYPLSRRVPTLEDQEFKPGALIEIIYRKDPSYRLCGVPHLEQATW